MTTLTRLRLVCFLALCTAASTATLIDINMNFNSLCKECQVHTAAVQDLLLHAGNETDNPGISQVVSLHIDYYGGWPTYTPHPNTTCETAARNLEHGPDRCTMDRYHLCAQHALPSMYEPKWFDYVHCLWMNIDTLKCHRNSFCKTRAEFVEALSLVHPMCAHSANVDGDAIRACAESPKAIDLQHQSYLKANQTIKRGFAPTYVDGKYLVEVPRWRLTVDMLSYGKRLLTTVCGIVASNNSSELPLGCRGLS